MLPGTAVGQNRPCPSSRLPIGLTRTQTAPCRRRHRCHPTNAPSPLPFPQCPKKGKRVPAELLPPHPAAPWEASPAPQPPRRRWWNGPPPPGPRSPSRPKRSTKGDRTLPAEHPPPPPPPERERAVGPKRGTTCAGWTAAACTQRFRVDAVTPPPAVSAPNHDSSSHPGISQLHHASARPSGCHFEAGRKFGVVTPEGRRALKGPLSVRPRGSPLQGFSSPPGWRNWPRTYI